MVQSNGEDPTRSVHLLEEGPLSLLLTVKLSAVGGETETNNYTIEANYQTFQEFPQSPSDHEVVVHYFIWRSSMVSHCESATH